LNEWDCSFNAFGSKSLLFTMKSDGFEYLLGGMRGNYGIQSGRYYFEMKMIDIPKLVKVGFSTASDSLYIEGKKSFGFDSLGDVYVAGEKTKNANPRWSRTDVVGLLLDVSEKKLVLFLNGTKTPTGQVTTIPEEFFNADGTLVEGLFPTVCAKGTAVECNFSTQVWKKLPFNVRMLGQAKLEDVVPCSKAKVTVMPVEEAAANMVQVYMPVGFDTRELIKSWESENVDGIVLSPEKLQQWGERSGLVKRPTQSRSGQQEKWGINCLDLPMSVFPMLLKGGRKYLFSLSNYHNLHPTQRQDIFAKLKHGLNVKLIGLVSVDDLISVSEGKKQVPPHVGEYYEHVKMPSKTEDFTQITYITSREDLADKDQEELAELVEEKFAAWKKDCKLKSKVTDLKKGTFFSTCMQAYQKLHKFQHKNTATAAKMIWQKEQDAKKAVKAAQKAKKEALAKKAAEEKEKAEAEKKEAEEKAEGEEGEKKEEAEKEEEKKEEVEEEEEEEVEEVLPAPMEEFTEEDWMLATLRAELHAVMWAFKEDVNDQERVSFPCIHFPYYYQFYTGKSFAITLASFACKTLEELTRLVPEMCKHTACMDEFALRKEKNPLVSDYDLVLPALPKDADISIVISMTEEARQGRTDRLDAGDENAALAFTYKPSLQGAPNARFPAGQQKPSSKGGENKPVYSQQQNFKRPGGNFQENFQAKRNRGGYNRR